MTALTTTIDCWVAIGKTLLQNLINTALRASRREHHSKSFADDSLRDDGFLWLVGVLTAPGFGGPKTEETGPSGDRRCGRNSHSSTQKKMLVFFRQPSLQRCAMALRADP